MIEEEKVFKATSDRMVYTITNEEETDSLVEISGYDLQFKFNLREIRTLEEAEQATSSMSNLFLKLLLEQLLLEQPPDIPPGV